MLVDFLHFAAMYAILITLIRLGQAKLAGTEWGKILAFMG